MFYIPNIKLVGYGRTQVFQTSCLKCKRLFFNFDSERDLESLFCDDCEPIEKLLKEKNISSINYIGNIIGWEIKADASQKRSRYNYQKVYKRDNYTCQYCLYSPYTSINFFPLHIDHLKPFHYGGSNKMDNLVVACAPCNLHANSKWFNTFEEKRQFILEKRNLSVTTKKEVNISPSVTT